MPVPEKTATEHTIAIVVPVYRGEGTLPELLDELEPYVAGVRTPGGTPYRVTEVVLVHDAGPDRSDLTIRALAERFPFVRPVWLARNFGQHAATLAGMSSTSAEWIVTMDEDGQHDPAAIARMLDTALENRAPLVYAAPTNPPPHSLFRNATSRLAHGVASVLGAGELSDFHSFRLVEGEVGRGLAAYCGESVFLDVALTWVVNRTATCPVEMREERGRPSGYSARRLASHFWRLVLTSGTRPLRLVAFFGAFLGLVAVVLLAWVVWARLTDQVSVQGWASTTVILLVTSGGILFSLGIMAEYLGIAAKSAMGKPLYLVVSDPAGGPLGRAAQAAPAPAAPEAASPAPAPAPVAPVAAEPITRE
jgi:undecaprenyl-phosphate 4-deoxy-4-formamido-L-arabinose transferase